MTKVIVAHMRESQLLTACVKYLRQLKADGEPVAWLKVHGSGMQRRGEPDLLICYHGRMVQAELKVGRNRPSPLQQYRLDQWAAAGATVGVVRCADDLRAMLSAVRQFVGR